MFVSCPGTIWTTGTDRGDVYLDRVTVEEAARRLGIKEESIRKRVQRGSLRADKQPDGRLLVYLDNTETNSSVSADMSGETQVISSDGDMLLEAKDETIAELRDQVDYLRREAEDWKEETRRKDTIIMSLTQRIPELEAATEPRESPVSDSDDVSKGAVPQEQGEGEIKRSWWRRFFGG